MRIPCPLCGLRDSSEFTYDGDSAAAQKRPAPHLKQLKPWVDYVFLRDNPMGKHKEIWQHSGGCRQFIELVRDTRTHQIYGSKLFESSVASGKKTAAKAKS